MYFFSISSKRLRELAIECEKFFNPEGKNKFDASYFYQPYVKKTDILAETRAGGIFHNKSELLRKEFKRLGLLQNQDLRPDGTRF